MKAFELEKKLNKKKLKTTSELKNVISNAQTKPQFLPIFWVPGAHEKVAAFGLQARWFKSGEKTFTRIFPRRPRCPVEEMKKWAFRERQ